MNHDNIKLFISLLRGKQVVPDRHLSVNDTSHHIIVEVFTKGNCGNFAMALKLAFGGEIMYIRDLAHLVCKIGDRLYDITGDVTDVYHSMVEVPSDSTVMEMFNNYSFEERGPLV